MKIIKKKFKIFSNFTHLNCCNLWAIKLSFSFGYALKVVLGHASSNSWIETLFIWQNISFFYAFAEDSWRESSWFYMDKFASEWSMDLAFAREDLLKNRGGGIGTINVVTWLLQFWISISNRLYGWLEVFCNLCDLIFFLISVPSLAI